MSVKRSDLPQINILIGVLQRLENAAVAVHMKGATSCVIMRRGTDDHETNVPVSSYKVFSAILTELEETWTKLNNLGVVKTDPPGDVMMALNDLRKKAEVRGG